MQGLAILLVCMTAVEADDARRELSRFPSRAECVAAMAIGAAQVEGFEAKQRWCISQGQWERLEAERMEAKERWWCWQHLLWAHELYASPTAPSHSFADDYVLHNTRQALDRLETWIGTIRWNLGAMPAP